MSYVGFGQPYTVPALAPVTGSVVGLEADSYAEFLVDLEDVGTLQFTTDAQVQVMEVTSPAELVEATTSGATFALRGRTSVVLQEGVLARTVSGDTVSVPKGAMLIVPDGTLAIVQAPLVTPPVTCPEGQWLAADGTCVPLVTVRPVGQVEPVVPWYKRPVTWVLAGVGVLVVVGAAVAYRAARK